MIERLKEVLKIKKNQEAQKRLSEYYKSERDGEFREGVEPPVDVYVNGIYKVVEDTKKPVD